MIASDTVWFSIVYAMLTLCIVAPTSEMVESGFTIAQLLRGIIEDENVDFIRHHMCLTATNTIVLQSILPLGKCLWFRSALT